MRICRLNKIPFSFSTPHTHTHTSWLTLLLYSTAEQRGMIIFFLSKEKDLPTWRPLLRFWKASLAVMLPSCVHISATRTSLLSATVVKFVDLIVAYRFDQDQEHTPVKLTNFTTFASPYRIRRIHTNPLFSIRSFTDHLHARVTPPPLP